jgi:signal transduction histidine kinase
VLVLLVVFIVAAPFAPLPLPRIDAFVPTYATAILVNDMITAALLFAQFSIVRSGALLALASGYLLTALIAIPWALTFPGVFAPGGLLGAGLHSAAWLYAIGHGGFPLFVIAYTLLKDADSIQPFSQGSIRAAIRASVGLVAAFVCSATALVTAGGEVMPALMLNDVRSVNLVYYVSAPITALIVLPLVLLWLRLRSVLDLWLMVVMCAYATEMAFNLVVPGRFTLAWYAGRVCGLLSGSLVLLILLQEIMMIYGQLLRAVLAQRREREARLMTGEAVSASIAHEVKQPITAIITNANAGLRWLGHVEPDLDEVKEALQHVVTAGHRMDTIVDNIKGLFKKDPRTRTSLDINNVIQEALALVRDNLRTHQVTVQADRNERLPPIRGVQIQLQQVLVNLITNAIDSMAATDGERVLSIRSEVHRSGCVMVSVEDTGKGLEPSAVDRIFNPLFTTKKHGMGMGLSICRSIIEAHDGQLWVTADRARGAIFHFTVPADPGKSHLPGFAR